MLEQDLIERDKKLVELKLANTILSLDLKAALKSQEKTRKSSCYEIDEKINSLVEFKEMKIEQIPFVGRSCISLTLDVSKVEKLEFAKLPKQQGSLSF